MLSFNYEMVDVHCKRPGVFQQTLVNPVAVKKDAF